MYITIIILPLLSGIISGLFGRCIGYKGASIISSINIIIASILSIYIFYEVGLNSCPTYIYIAPYINTDSININWELAYDSITTIMLMVISIISMCVIIYSTSYMLSDPHICRFLSYLNLFSFFMMVLVTSNNLIIMFIGWEGIGVVSYLLIGFWHTRIATSKASIKAMIMNRIGDMGISIGIIAIYELMGSVEYNIINNTSYIYDTITSIIIISIFIGSMGKSAQLGLHTWLSDAMQGPTPVSSLLHAATLVTAGIFLNIKLSSILELNNTCLIIITIVGSLTTIYGALMGTISNDIKSIIAFSTMSQLGLMILSIGLSNYAISLYHLFNHAFVKALLFLSAGAIIHNIYNEQDLRKMGGYINYLPLPYITILIASLSLGGFPFLSCFYSKDIILESSWSNYIVHSSLSFFLSALASLLTVIYSFKIIIYTFLSTIKSSNSLMPSTLLSYRIIIPLILLSIPSLYVGYLFKELFLSTYFSDSIYSIYNTLNVYEFIPLYIKLIPVLVSIGGIIIAFLYFTSSISQLSKFNTFTLYLTYRGYIDYIYNSIITRFILYTSHHTFYKTLDRGIFEYIGPYGLTNSITYISRYLSYIHSGYIYHYILVFIIVILITILLAIP